MLEPFLEMFFELFGEGLVELFCWVATKVLITSYDFIRTVVNEIFQ